MKKIICTAIILLLSCSAGAKTFRIVVPYAGVLNNQLEVEHLNENLDDSALMKGLYFQWVNTKQYQWNLFLYHASNLNYSTVLGSHLIFDYYLGAGPKGKTVLGAGFDYIQINTEADVIQSLTGFVMDNRIYSPYIRAGQYFDFKQNQHMFSFFVWGGYEHDFLKGDLSFSIPTGGPFVPAMPISENLDKEYDYALIGLALKATLFHFLELQFKYHLKMDVNSDHQFNYYSILTNIYLNRRWAVSYRYKNMEETIGTNIYHIGGIAFLF